MSQKAKLIVPADTRYLEMVRHFVSRMATLAGLKNDETHQIELAVDEACTNVILHGYNHDDSKSFSVACSFDESALTVDVEDRGKSFDFDAVPKPDVQTPIEERQVGGLGIYFIRQIMDDVSYYRSPDGPNRLSMKKSIRSK